MHNLGLSYLFDKILTPTGEFNAIFKI